MTNLNNFGKKYRDEASKMYVDQDGNAVGREGCWTAYKHPHGLTIDKATPPEVIKAFAVVVAYKSPYHSEGYGDNPTFEEWVSVIEEGLLEIQATASKNFDELLACEDY